jgi:serine/threonine-protein phosphatase PGAM5
VELQNQSIQEDETRILTPLGRDQAHLTGKRIAEMIQGAEETFGSPCHVKALRVSNLTRAKETAAIIASYLPSTVAVIDPDPMLNEGRPCHTIPGGRMSPKDIETTDQHHPRIEGAFRKYIHRAPEPPDTTTPPSPPESKHEFEIIVCHANVIRYIMCRYVDCWIDTTVRYFEEQSSSLSHIFRCNSIAHKHVFVTSLLFFVRPCAVLNASALQLPPEAWLRFCPFNCSLTYLTIRPTGTVSCRMIGDIGHLPYSASTFSGHHGYNW